MLGEQIRFQRHLSEMRHGRKRPEWSGRERVVY
jgi:hypothetical protein